jgi:nucleotide-binding universal stress UspA family protein
MFDKIVHASDGSKYAFLALTWALALAKQNNSELHIVCVEEVPYLPESIGEVSEALNSTRQRIEGVFEQARAIAEKYQVKLNTHVITGHPVRDIVTLAADLEADLLVIGARGHSSFYQRMIGSKADRMVQLAKCPVLVVKEDEAKVTGPMFGKILHANDGSKSALRGLSIALAIARQNQSEFHMVSVEEAPYSPGASNEARQPTGDIARRIEELVQRARALADEQQVQIHAHAIKGHPVRDIVNLAVHLGADLLVIGAVGHTALFERLIGSRANQLMQLARCPVLIVK